MTIPSATYRLQLRRELPLDAARGLVSYLARLGISDLYLSPLSTARAGSPHGYDVVDHRRLNPELGDDRALGELLDAAHAANLGVILDVVPNHMCIAGDMNSQWMDVLEDGRESPSAATFDIDWDPPKPELVGKVLLPFLGEQYGRVLEEGLAVTFAGGRFFATWDGGRLPLRPNSWPRVLAPALQDLRAQASSPEDAAVIELESILRALSQTLPALRASGAASAQANPGAGAGAGAGGVTDAPTEHRHEKEAIVRRLAALTESCVAARDAIARAVVRVNGTRGQPASFDELEHMMNDQCYRLANWRVAAHEVNYRRFFDINELAAVRVEDPRVFEEVHALAFEVAKHPAFTGVRVDHLDGLSDPVRYLGDLARGLEGARTPGEAGPDDRVGDGRAARPFVVVEKILGPGETLPAEWLCDGTTGYDLIPILADLFVRPDGATRLRAVAAPFGALSSSFEQVMYESKRLVLQTTLAAELTVLARRLDRVSEQHRYTRDFTLNQLEAALGDILACLPVYRTYIRRDDTTVTGRDADAITRAVTAARRRNPLLNASLFDFVESVLLRRDPPDLPEAAVEERRTFVARFQQLTGPVFAKGVEDTAFYRYLPLCALNEVGGDPTRMGAATDDVHEALRARGQASPHTMSTTATHDTKRGEDTRARLYVLSEAADGWASATVEWSMLNAPHKTDVDGAAAPDGAEEYLLYQTLVGAWPLHGWQSEPDFADRVSAYMTKARHEAKTRTSWINPHPAYDRAAERFTRAVLDRTTGATGAKFLDSVEAFVATIRRPGLWNALSQVVTKIAAPGVPDFFQGTELWDFSLVDPDNRRLVDFDRRRAWLDQVLADFEARQTTAIDAWIAAPEDGRIKLWTTAAALRLRRARRDLFERGTYQPLAVGGARADHAFAFARSLDGAIALAVVGRFFATLGADRPTGRAWGDTFLHLPAPIENQRFRDALTGRLLAGRDGRLPLAELFAHLPVALLEGVP